MALFKDFKADVIRLMEENYGLTDVDLGFSYQTWLKYYHTNNTSAQEFIEWYAEKYDLIEI